MAEAKVPRWSRLPIGWIVNGGLVAFRGGHELGESVAALKLYVAIVLLAKNAREALHDPDQGSVLVSYDDLMGMTDLSRAMIARGVKRLETAELVTVKRGRRGEANRYVLTGYAAADRWAKVSNRRLFRGGGSNRIGVLHDLSPRRVCDLNALKLYLLFAAFQDKDGGGAMLGYEKITDYSGMASGQVRRAVSVLVEQGLIVVDSGPDPLIPKQNPPNRYRLLGLSFATEAAPALAA